jgi:succinate dehydrogenase/fumarate reductase flavoprotein subunit
MPHIAGPANLSEIEPWDRTADVVVVGLGVAGACAALEAHRRGVEVLVLERASGGGGASAASEGIFYLGGGTAAQEACGYKDDPDNMFAFMRASTTTPDEASLRLFCDGSSEHLDWLEAQGVPFERRSYTGKAVAVRTGEGLLSTGNEKVWPFRDIARAVPRGHQSRASAEEKGGAVAMRALLATFAAEGVPVVFDARVTGLVVDDAGRVRGVRYQQDGRERTVEARRGVILAAGSFNLNKAMTDANLPVISRYGQPLGIDTNDGAGVLLGQSVGAVTRGMDGVIATASIYPPAQLIKGVVVNARGERFVAEDSYHGRLAWHIERQPDHLAYLILDEETFAYPEKGSHKLIDGWDTVEEMESGLGVPPGSLTATLTEYNRDVADGVDRRFRKHPDWLKPLAGPFAAFDISIPHSDYHYISLGGLVSDQDGRALKADGQPVPGLYAVGACAAHFPQNGAEYASGMSLGPGSFFGRQAGRHAADHA